ncbi:MAG: PEP-utilizing enzyme [Chloroflexi bacterium]|nr:PEP-utilizing enzyme [Chloroflexota bacterium]
MNTPTGKVMDALGKTSDGRRFAESVGAYLRKWGNRSDTVIEIGDPSWLEDPAIVINNLKAYLGGSAHDPRAQWLELVADRERLVNETQTLIAGYPEPVRQQFNGMLAAGQNGQRIQEDHNWWIDQQGNYQVRQVYLEFGDRLAAAGAISHRDDVFMLTGDEIADSARSGFGGDFKSAVSERRAEMERWQKVPAAPAVGTDYGPPPDNPVTRALGRFFGTPPAPASPDHPELISGAPGSPGKVTGTARVIIKLSDASRLKQGDILVTATTSPPWTPIFATAGGIVTDTGGALSHCAIVAREYGIPATVGTLRATAVIKDGQRVEVDGDAGTVRILKS